MQVVSHPGHSPALSSKARMNPLLKAGSVSPERPTWLNLGIRGKIIFPYLLLTLALAILGAYIVTQLIAGSIEERFNNQLVNAGQVAADGLVRLERSHLELWRILAATEGLSQAARAGDAIETRLLIEGQIASRGAGSVIVVNADHRGVLAL